MIHSPTVLSMKQKPCTGYLKNIIQPVFREYNIHRFQRITGVKFKLSGRRTIELPYIPESFLEQKRTKTSRKRRRSDVKSSDIEDLDFSVTTPEWTVLGEKKEPEGNKDDIFHLIRSVIAYSDKNENFDLKNDFENITVEQIQNSDELREKMKTVISFIYYYCRGELGFFQERPPISISDLQLWLSALNS